MLLFALLAACAAPGGGDPREAIRAALPRPGGAVPTAEVVEERLLLDELPAACAGARARVATEGAPEDWRILLTAAARSGPGRCLGEADGDGLATWAAGRDAGDHGGWRAAAAEWRAARGDVAGAEALLPAGGDGAPARVRVALAKGDGDAALAAAEETLVTEGRDTLACRLVVQRALEEADLAWAVEQSACGGLGDRSPALRRLRAEALDRAGEIAAAEALDRALGLDVHLAALLYQEAPTPERLEEAARLLAPGPDGTRPPPAALHAAWLALLTGAPATVDGLDHSVPAALARALIRGSDDDRAAIAAAPGAAAAIVRARIAVERGEREAAERALGEALTASPAAEPVHRARVALRVASGGDVDGALADWAAQDPDHVAAVGDRGSRDLPWKAVVPETWEELARRHPDPRMRRDAPSGRDEVGEALRKARQAADPRARADALGEVAGRFVGLDAVAAERYRLAPPVVGAPDRAP